MKNILDSGFHCKQKPFTYIYLINSKHVDKFLISDRES